MKLYLSHNLFKIIILCSMIFLSFGVYGQVDNLKQLYKQHKYDTLIDILTQRSKKRELTIKELYRFGKIYQKLTKYSNSLVHANELIQKCKREFDSTYLFKAYNLKCENLIDLNKTEEGIAFCETISKEFRPKDSLELQLLYFKWGMLYYQQEQYLKALDIYDKITVKKYTDFDIFIHNYGLILLELGDDKKGFKNLKASIAHNKKTEDKNGLAQAYSNIAYFLIKLKKLKQAKIYLDSANVIPKKHLTLRTLRYKYNHLYSYYRHSDFQDISRAYLDSIYICNEMIYKQKVNQEIQEIKTSYEREQKLKRKVQIKDSELERFEKQMLQGIISFLAVLITVLSLMFLYIYKNIKNQNKSILLENRLLQSQMTPHFIFNALSVLQGMILNKKETQAMKYLSKFSKLLRMNLENSRIKFVVLTEEIKEIEHYLELQNLGSEIPFKYSITVEEAIKNQLMVPPMLIQPFIENAIVHGFTNECIDKQIDISITFNNKKLQCMVCDNGIGIEHTLSKKSTTKKSLAIIIIKERLQLLAKECKQKTKVTIEDRKHQGEHGTQVYLVLPYKNL